MFQNMKKRIKNEKGLTLIELLAVVVILAIIAAIAIPAIGNIIDNSRIKAAKADAINIINAANMYYTDGNETLFSNALNADVIDEYVADLGSFSNTGSTYSVNTEAEFSGSVTVSGDITITFTDATVSAINAESPEGNGTSVVVSEGATGGTEDGAENN